MLLCYRLASWLLLGYLTGVNSWPVWLPFMIKTEVAIACDVAIAIAFAHSTCLYSVVQFDAMTVSLSSSYDNVAASWSRHLDWVGYNEYFDIHVLIHYLSSLPHTLRPTGTSFYASLSCRMDTPLIRTAYSLRVLIHLGGLVSCTDMLRSCANPQRQNHTSSTHFGLQSTLFCWSIELTAVLIVYLPGRMGWADCLQHMARVPVVHLNRACIVPFLLSFVLLLVLLHRRVLQTAVGCGHTLVDGPEGRLSA
jgi:hypothetical protein